MKIAIMQPYIFPYLGYFQLIAAVDKFIVYDDVNFIKQGWINRNNILLNGQRHLFSLPVENLTSFKKINETRVSSRSYEAWFSKFDKTLQMAYKKAPFFADVYPMVSRMLAGGEASESIAQLCIGAIREVNGYLGIDTVIQPTCAHYGNDSLKAEERVMDICKQEFAAVYVNAIGGQELYSKDVFRERGIGLSFLKSGETEYRQLNHAFVPHLSIIDALMFNSPEAMAEHLKNFELV
jgi:WbqC-like protein family